MAEDGTMNSNASRCLKGSEDIQILDGGMSRELMRLNAPFKQPEWSAQALFEAPDLVEQVHREFAAAGADILTTNTYAIVPFHIGEERFWQRGSELAALAGRLARNAANEEQARSGRKVLVAGSLPPIFGSYQPELFQPEKVQDYLSILVDGLAPYVDVWLGETLSLIAEAEAVASAVCASGKPFWISFHLDEHRENVGSATKDTCLRSGELVVDAACRVTDLGAAALLFNCNIPEVMDAAILEAKVAFEHQARSIPIGVYANAFESKPDEYAANENISSTRSDLEEMTYAKMAHRWVESGATIIGGCCGIGVSHIGQLARQLKSEPTRSK